MPRIANRDPTRLRSIYALCIWLESTSEDCLVTSLVPSLTKGQYSFLKSSQMFKPISFWYVWRRGSVMFKPWASGEPDRNRIPPVRVRVRVRAPPSSTRWSSQRKSNVSCVPHCHCQQSIDLTPATRHPQLFISRVRISIGTLLFQKSINYTTD